MADTAFTNGVTLTDSDWFNDLNRLHYTLFADPANLASAHQAFFSGGVAQNIAVGGTLSVSAGSFVQALQVGGVLSVSALAAVQALRVAGVLSVSAGSVFAGITIGGITSASAGVATAAIMFPATQVASANVNTLDDYEEGSWTPTLTFATVGDLSVTYETQVGQYTKIGREVIIRWSIETATFTHTTASGNLLLGGIPFASGSVSGLLKAGTCAWTGITKASYTEITPIVNLSSVTQLEFKASGSAQGSVQVTTADVPTGGTVRLFGQLTYSV